MRQLRRLMIMTLVASLTIGSPRRAQAYGLSTHILLVDLLWDHDILRLLTEAFPATNPKDYEELRRYAYSGAVLQDSGYYYYRGDKEAIAEIEHFSDMTHYARSGDFVANLFRSATDAKELAFALGALTHYVGDIEGHSLATNRSVPLAFPNQFPAYNVVTYEQDPSAHLQVEFGFDVNAAKLMRLRPPCEMKYSKANLSLQQLTYAYYRTYGMHKDLTWTGDGFSARAFYASANFILPAGTYLRARAEKQNAVQEPDYVGLQAMIDNVATEEHWKRTHHYSWMPRPMARMLLHTSSKSAMVMPDATTQLKYATSVVLTVNKLRTMIASIDPHAAIFIPLWLPDGATVAASPLPNKNLDTGEDESPGSYGLSDKIHQVWLAELAATSKEYPNWPMPASVQSTLHSFFSRPLFNWNAAEVQKEMDSAMTLPVWPKDEPCPIKDPKYKEYFGWHMVNPEGYNQIDPKHPSLCPYPTPQKIVPPAS